MKILSEYKELSGQVFNSIDECAAAEHEIDAAKLLEKEKATKQSARKKELATAIEVAEKAVKEAYDARIKTKEEVQKVLEESNKKMMAMLDDANVKVRDAEKARRDAILAYNNEFGTYQAVYTGERAQREFDRLAKQFDSTFTDMIRRFII
jgi:formiminotetrahydrofolate cyclodeaminase